MIKVKYVTRIDSGNTHGWWIRISKYKKKRQKFFADLKFGSKDWAFFQSLIWLDIAEEELEKTKVSIKMLLKRPTGMQGKSIARVRRYSPKTGRNKDMAHWICGWGSKENRNIKTFSVNKYGEEPARQKAEAMARAVNQGKNIY